MNFRLKSYRHHGRCAVARRILIAFTVIMFLQVALTVKAAPEEFAATDMKINGLRTTSESLVIDSTHSVAELIGNVKITQGSTVITADNVKIFAKSAHADAEEAATATSVENLVANGIEKLVANGNVRIELDKGVATSEKATYNSETKIIVLSGSGTKFISGGNTISGSVIIVNRDTGTVKVESSSSQPVEAVIFSEDKL